MNDYIKSEYKKHEKLVNELKHSEGYTHNDSLYKGWEIEGVYEDKYNKVLRIVLLIPNKGDKTLTIDLEDYRRINHNLTKENIYFLKELGFKLDRIGFWGTEDFEGYIKEIGKRIIAVIGNGKISLIRYCSLDDSGSLIKTYNYEEEHLKHYIDHLIEEYETTKRN